MAYQDLPAITTDLILDELPDGLSRANPLLNYFMSEEGSRFKDGGLTLQASIKLHANQSSGFIGGSGDILPTSPSQQYENMNFNWKYYVVTANQTLDDYTRAQGPNSPFNYLKESVEGALADSYRELSEAVYASSEDNSYAFEGLADITAESGVSYGGLNDTDFADGTFLPYESDSNTLNYATMSKIMAILRGRMQKERGFARNSYIGVINPAGFAVLQQLVQNQQRFYDQGESVDMGWEHVYVNTVKFFLDADCPGTGDAAEADNHMYILPKGALKLYFKYGIGKGNKSPLDGEQRLPKQTINSIQTFIAGNMIATNRRLIGFSKSLIV